MEIYFYFIYFIQMGTFTKKNKINGDKDYEKQERVSCGIFKKRNRKKVLKFTNWA